MSNTAPQTILVVATRNQHKIGEIRTILGESLRYFSLAEFNNVPDIIEDADSFAGNARLKALGIRAFLRDLPRLPWPSTDRVLVLADDSGLAVDALNGAPGVHSARFANLDTGAPGNSPDAANNAKLLRLLNGVPAARRTARFCCAIAIAALKESSAESPVFEGACEGTLLETPSGGGGFGYDPFFVPLGYHQSFAQLGEMIKNELSHRSKALAQCRAWLDQC